MGVKRSFIYGTLGFLIFLAMLNFVYAENIACYSDSDCISGFVGKEFCSNNDVYKNFINSSCINPGTITSYCSDVTIPILLPTGDCGNDEFGVWSSNYCSNNNVYHSRTGTLRGCRVINPLTNISGCYSEIVFQEEVVQNCSNGCNNGVCNPIICNCDSDCGANEFCDFNNGLCHAPGICVQVPDICPTVMDPVCGCNGVTYSNDCSRKFVKVSKSHNGACEVINCSSNSQCGTNVFTGSLICQNGNVYQDFITFTCNNPGAADSYCSDLTSSQLKQTCLQGQSCSNGQCLNVICSNDSQCGKNGFTINKYCKNNEVYAGYNEYKCLNPGTANSSCFVNTTLRLFEDCEYKCKNDECYSKNTENYPDYEFNDSEQQVYGYTGDVILMTTPGNNNLTTQETAPVIKIGNSTTSKLSLSNLLWILIILIIVLLVLIIILVMMR